jgi:hypothetical protein
MTLALCFPHARLPRRCMRSLFLFFLTVFAITFALAPYDPSTGRARGCYTGVESLLGLKQPSEVVRGTEQFVGLSLTLLLPILAGAMWLRSHLTRRRTGAL